MSKNKGFTLIEMMIVLAIIGIMAAMTYPNLSRAVDMSNNNDLLQQKYVVNKALIEYYALTGTYLSQSGDPISELTNQTGVNFNTEKYQYSYQTNKNGIFEIDVGWKIKDSLW